MRGKHRFRPLTIGGTDWRTLAAGVTPEHTPQDRHDYRDAVHDLASLNMDAGAVARVLGLTKQQVTDLLREPVLDARGRLRRSKDSIESKG